MYVPVSWGPQPCCPILARTSSAYASTVCWEGAALPLKGELVTVNDHGVPTSHPQRLVRKGREKRSRRKVGQEQAELQPYLWSPGFVPSTLI